MNLKKVEDLNDVQLDSYGQDALNKKTKLLNVSMISY